MERRASPPGGCAGRRVPGHFRALSATQHVFARRCPAVRPSVVVVVVIRQRRSPPQEPAPSSWRGRRPARGLSRRRHVGPREGGEPMRDRGLLVRSCFEASPALADTPLLAARPRRCWPSAPWLAPWTSASAPRRAWRCARPWQPGSFRGEHAAEHASAAGVPPGLCVAQARPGAGGRRGGHHGALPPPRVESIGRGNRGAAGACARRSQPPRATAG